MRLMQRCQRDEMRQPGHDFRRQQLGIAVFLAAMHDAMADRDDIGQAGSLFEPGQQVAQRRLMIIDCRGNRDRRRYGQRIGGTAAHVRGQFAKLAIRRRDTHIRQDLSGVIERLEMWIMLPDIFLQAATNQFQFAAISG